MINTLYKCVVSCAWIKDVGIIHCPMETRKTMVQSGISQVIVVMLNSPLRGLELNIRR